MSHNLCSLPEQIRPSAYYNTGTNGCRLVCHDLGYSEAGGSWGCVESDADHLYGNGVWKDY